jgi:hypothetical protein
MLAAENAVRHSLPLGAPNQIGGKLAPRLKKEPAPRTRARVHATRRFAQPTGSDVRLGR